MRIGPMELFIICLIPILLLVGILIVSFLVNAVKKSPSGVRSEPDRIPCPYCAEMILPGAKICRYCGRELSINGDS